MPIPITSTAILIIPKSIIKQKMNLDPKEYINQLGFTDSGNFVIQDDYLVGVKGTDGNELLSDRFINKLDCNDSVIRSQDFTIASYFAENILWWDVDWLTVDTPFLVWKDQYPLVQEKLNELKSMPMKKFMEYWKENAF